MSDDGASAMGIASAEGALAFRAGKGIWTAGAAIVVGIAAGLMMMLQQREVACADGTFFREGETDFRCFSHPHALMGAAVIAAFVGLGAIVYLAWIVITALDARSEPSL